MRTIPGCPNAGPALKLFRGVLEAEGKDAGHLRLREVTSENEAETLHFHGSPTFMAGGRDLFPSESAAALSCRVYHFGNRVTGLPSAESLRTAVRGIISEQ